MVETNRLHIKTFVPRPYATSNINNPCVPTAGLIDMGALSTPGEVAQLEEAFSSDDKSLPMADLLIHAVKEESSLARRLALATIAVLETESVLMSSFPEEAQKSCIPLLTAMTCILKVVDQKVVEVPVSKIIIGGMPHRFCLTGFDESTWLTRNAQTGVNDSRLSIEGRPRPFTTLLAYLTHRCSAATRTAIRNGNIHLAIYNAFVQLIVSQPYYLEVEYRKAMFAAGTGSGLHAGLWFDARKKQIGHNLPHGPQLYMDALPVWIEGEHPIAFPPPSHHLPTTFLPSSHHPPHL